MAWVTGPDVHYLDLNALKCTKLQIYTLSHSPHTHHTTPPTFIVLNASPEILGLKTMEPISKILWWLEFPPVAIRFAGYNCMGQFTTLTCSGILFISLPLSDILSLFVLYDLKKFIKSRI